MPSKMPQENPQYHLDKCTNTNILEEANIPTITAIITQHQLRWNGHVIRMFDSRLPKQVLYSQPIQHHSSIIIIQLSIIHLFIIHHPSIINHPSSNIIHLSSINNASIIYSSSSIYHQSVHPSSSSHINSSSIHPSSFHHPALNQSIIHSSINHSSIHPSSLINQPFFPTAAQPNCYQ